MLKKYTFIVKIECSTLEAVDFIVVLLRSFTLSVSGPVKI